MKKTVGIIFLVLSLFMVSSGAVLITQANAYKDSIDGNMRYELSSSFSAETKVKNTAGWILIVVGCGFFINGIWKLTRKSIGQIQMESEYWILKKRYKNETGSDKITQ